jgi:hypothetical protein
MATDSEVCKRLKDEGRGEVIARVERVDGKIVVTTIRESTGTTEKRRILQEENITEAEELIQGEDSPLVVDGDSISG